MCEKFRQEIYDCALGEHELTTGAREHMAECPSCREELARLGLTQKLVRQGLPEEEPPRRIAFVAEPRPNPLRFWQGSFAGATAFALLFAVLAWKRPAPIGGAEFTRDEVAQIVREAVAASEQRQRATMEQVIQAAGERMREQLYQIQSMQSDVYRQTEQNRADLRHMAALVGGRP
jgi:hypothetical protein